MANTVGTSIYRHPFRDKSIGASGKFREKGVAVTKSVGTALVLSAKLGGGKFALRTYA